MKRVVVVKNLATIVFLLAFLIFLPVARADESNQATKVTFNQAVQIPGRVLPAGTYWFVLPADITQHNQVRIFGSDRTTLYATIFTIGTDRREPTDNTAFTFAARESQPQALVAWFYPGEKTGHEFLYPKQLQTELARDKQDTIMAGD
ncbi:MAG: hypothetical protein WCA38_07005 [Candidatus Acidiferrales bacterium]